ncbi:MAG: transglutaminase-like domain-containing protein [Rubripirellula sp.]
MNEPQFFAGSKYRIGRWIFVIGISCLSLQAESAEPVRTYSIPFEGRESRGFSFRGDQLFVFHHPSRALYASDPRGVLVPMEDMKGWAISDVTIVGDNSIYCSRDRTLRKINGKVVTRNVPGTSNLTSIASFGSKLYLLDATDRPAIVCLDSKTGRQLYRKPYDGLRPRDIAVNRNGVFVLDFGDRCIHQLKANSGETKTRIQIGPGVVSGSGGLAFLRGKELYVHEADFRRFRPITWQQDEHMISSWSMPLKMTFVQESDNESTTKTSVVDFEVPVPTRGFSQVVSDVTWSQPPDEVVDDRFGQSIARFRDIAVPPGGHHELSYELSVYSRAVQYDPPRLPLEALKTIPSDVRDQFLARDPVYCLDSPDLIAEAAKARLDSQGKEPSDVRTLIENIAWYQSRQFNYVMDDTWDDSLATIQRGTGSCSEYSFVFSSLCRLNGVPTRLVGGVQVGDYGKRHETSAFHRWTEVYFPTIGWIPVDTTKFDDGTAESRDFEFLFGTPGYLICVSRGGVDLDLLGKGYFIRRHYRGGKRVRRTYVVFEPHESKPVDEVVLRLP